MSFTREVFAQRQAEMTQRWYDGVVRNADDLENYIKGRQVAYNARWNEALRFMPAGSRILDIGGGNLYHDLLGMLKAKGLDYWYIDVDPGPVDWAKRIGAEYGYDPEQFRQGFNDVLDYADESFDAVFSSHCIEHSFDLQKTLSEIRRVLKPQGMLTMAVPFGWEHNPEHPYFFEASDWIALVEDAGFEVRLAQVGREYPENGYDLFVAARKSDIPGERRVHPALYAKEKLTFLSHVDQSVTYSGNFETKPDSVICRGEWGIRISVPHGAKRILPILARHPWSGIVRIRCGGNEVYRDLSSWYSYYQPIEIAAEGNADVEIVPIGQSPISRGREGVLVGVLIQ